GELSVAFMYVLERLGPEERAAFLLRQVFDYDYPEIAAQLGKTEASCRQMVHRASERVQQARTRFEVPQAVHHQLLQRFMKAAQSGDRHAIEALLSEDAQLIGDGGGIVPSFPKPLVGPFRITNLYWAVFRRLGAQVVYRMALINGEPGLLRYVGGRIESAQAFVTDGERIVAIYAVRNPDKLAGIPAMLPL
ncbi:RNA polymerase subunit sigma-24, partial [Acidovorax sp. HMWF018]|uniref:sigma factor-like helix-turn-helix DNA-binding protein n=1 Tax=Acidovorax sp. HMWF018 TaxID=2056855 RepID=UPI000D3BA2DE